jgi:hypothetical protein
MEEEKSSENRNKDIEVLQNRVCVLDYYYYL